MYPPLIAPAKSEPVLGYSPIRQEKDTQPFANVTVPNEVFWSYNDRACSHKKARMHCCMRAAVAKT